MLRRLIEFLCAMSYVALYMAVSLSYDTTGYASHISRTDPALPISHTSARAPFLARARREGPVSRHLHTYWPRCRHTQSSAHCLVSLAGWCVAAQPQIPPECSNAVRVSGPSTKPKARGSLAHTLRHESQCAMETGTARGVKHNRPCARVQTARVSEHLPKPK